ncbi:MAG: hypothetical protein GWN86_26305 [Desulfobacterales bacterium]|nr:hypothetical protein [Desulfobacterales bacterium]
MGFVEAFWGGFSSFFSIWQICASQISPFFMAFLAGFYFVGLSREGQGHYKRWVVVPCLSYIVGFSILYSLLSSPGLGIGRYLSYNLGAFRLLSGGYILFVSMYILFPDKIGIFKRLDGPFVLAGLSLILGVAFAVVYSPCITPTLSKILGLVNDPRMAARAATLALYYGAGLAAAFGATGLILVRLLGGAAPVVMNLGRSRAACGLILGVLALLNITGFMTYYKAFVLGMLVK